MLARALCGIARQYLYTRNATILILPPGLQLLLSDVEAFVSAPVRAIAVGMLQTKVVFRPELFCKAIICRHALAYV